MERSATAARAWVGGECLGVSAAFAAALLIAPLVGGVALRPALALAAMAVAALAVAYGRALTPLLGLSAAVPHYLVWVVVGSGAASLVHLTVTAALNLGVWPALVADVVGVLALTVARAVRDRTSRRRHTVIALAASSASALPSGPVTLATQMAVLIVCAALASLWAREVITAVPHTLATGVFPAWQDYFLHASEITYLRDYPAFERHSQYLAAVPQPLYHRGSYALASVFSALSGLPSLTTATTFWLPTGLLLCITATYTFGAAMGGGLGGLAAVAAVFLAPDASGYGFHNRFLSFHWLLQMAGGSSYAVALVLVALTRVVTALPAGRTRALLVAGGLTLASAGFRVHVAALATGMVCVLAVLAWRPAVRPASVAWAVAGAALAAGGLWWLESVALAPHFLSAGARPVLFFLSVHTQASALPSPWVDWTEGAGPVWKVVLGYVMMLAAGCGAWVAVLAAVWSGGALSRLGWRVGAIPVALAAAHLAVILLVPTPAHGDLTDFGHRPFVLVYLVVAALAGAGVARLLGDWSRRRYASSAPAAAALVAAAAVGLIVPWTVGPTVQQTWTPQYASIPVSRGTFEAGAFVRSHSTAGDLVLAASEDPLAVLVALTERRAYLSRTSLYRSLGPDTAALANARAAAHGALASVTSFEQLRAFGARTGVAWYIDDTPDAAHWPAVVAEHSVFNRGGVRVYDLR